MKAHITLPPFYIAETTRFTVEADHELTQTLRRYQAFYKEGYGATMSESELPREMARRLMAADGNFQGFGQKKCRSRWTQSAASAAEPSNNGKLSFGGPVT